MATLVKRFNENCGQRESMLVMPLSALAIFACQQHLYSTCPANLNESIGLIISLHLSAYQAQRGMHNLFQGIGHKLRVLSRRRLCGMYRCLSTPVHFMLAVLYSKQALDVQVFYWDLAVGPLHEQENWMQLMPSVAPANSAQAFG
jgi:hypothetical protein